MKKPTLPAITTATMAAITAIVLVIAVLTLATTTPINATQINAKTINTKTINVKTINAKTLNPTKNAENAEKVQNAENAANAKKIDTKNSGYCPGELNGVINYAVVCDKENVRVTGNTEINPPGSITLRNNAAMRFTGAYTLDFEAGTTLDVSSSTVASDSNANADYEINVKNGAKASLQYSAFKNAANIKINAANAGITNNVFENKENGLIVSGAGSTVTYNEFKSKGANIHDSNQPNANTNQLEGNGLTVLGCDACEIAYNNANGNANGAGIHVQNGRGVLVHNNQAYYNKDGIRLSYASNGEVYGNDASYNSRYGLFDQEPVSNNIYGNSFKYNGEAGVKLLQSVYETDWAGEDPIPSPTPVVHQTDSLSENEVEFNLGDGILAYGVNINWGAKLEKIKSNVRAGVVWIDVSPSRENELGANGIQKSVVLYTVRVQALLPNNKIIEQRNPLNIIVNEDGDSCDDNKNDARRYDAYYSQYECHYDSQNQVLVSQDLWINNEKPMHKFTNPEVTSVLNYVSDLFLIRKSYLGNNDANPIDACPAGPPKCKIVINYVNEQNIVKRATHYVGHRLYKPLYDTLVVYNELDESKDGTKDESKQPAQQVSVQPLSIQQALIQPAALIQAALVKPAQPAQIQPTLVVQTAKPAQIQPASVQTAKPAQLVQPKKVSGASGIGITSVNSVSTINAVNSVSSTRVKALKVTSG